MQSRGGFSSFEIYLRTGRRMQAAVEVKFNPWHDPEDGRFTFVGQGRYFPRGQHQSKPSQASSSATLRDAESGLDRRAGHPGSSDSADPDYSGHDPKDPRNYSVYVVRRGDTLTGIARQRKGLTASDLAWLNEMPLDRRLRIGQQIKVPHQQFLDRGREARDRFRALDYYMRTHGGRLPPDVANPPSLESQILDSNWKQEIRGPYNFYIDILSRLRKAFGQVPATSMPKRSEWNQKRAGKPDRRPTDDGGHYIAARLGGPTDAFNHFAQDLNFNRGAYRDLEKVWYEAARAGHKVFLDIVPHYVGTSRRPDSVLVIWYIDGRKYQKNFPNESTKGSNDKR